MEIRKIAFASFKLTFNEVTIITDPLLSARAGDKFSQQEADAVLITEHKYVGEHDLLKSEDFNKIAPQHRENIMEISSPGDYEIGGVLIRRKLDTDYYVIDENDIRIVYFGAGVAAVTPDKLKDLGDVDLLIMPVGDGGQFPDYEQVTKIISVIDPTKLVISAFSDGVKLSEEFKDTKSSQDFIKHTGYTHVTEDKKLKVTKGVEEESKVMEVVILK